MALPPLVLSLLPAGLAAGRLAGSLGQAHPLDGQEADPSTPLRFDLEALAGRMSELRGDSTLTIAFALVLEAQHRGEPAAYVTGSVASFYPPDVMDGGVDLDALVVIRAAEATARARAADELLRSGAFALVLVDLADLQADARQSRIPPALLSRLHALAQKHHSALVFLNCAGASAGAASGDEAPSLLGSLISLRAMVRRRPVGESRSRFDVCVEVVKDKRRAPGWTHTERCRGPVGLA